MPNLSIFATIFSIDFKAYNGVVWIFKHVVCILIDGYLLLEPLQTNILVVSLVISFLQMVRWRGTLTQPFSVKLFKGIWNAHPRYATKTVMVVNNDVDGAFSVLNRYLCLVQLRFFFFHSLIILSHIGSMLESRIYGDHYAFDLTIIGDYIFNSNMEFFHSTRNNHFQD